VTSAYLLAYGIGNFLLFISGIAAIAIFGPFLGMGFSSDAVVDFDQPVYLLFYTTIAALQLLISFGFFKIRRFKKGFLFLFKKYAVVITLITAGITLAIFSIADRQMSNGTYDVVAPVVIGCLIIGSGIIIWIRLGMKVYYKNWAKRNNDELHQSELAQKDGEILRLTEICDTLRTANHSINHRLAACEDSLCALANKLCEQGKIDDEIAPLLDDIKRVSADYQSSVKKVKTKKPLPPTKIQMIDAMLRHFAEKFADSGVDFTLKVCGSVLSMVEQAVEQGRLETMIGDHLQNALIAIYSGDNPVRSILAVIGLVGDYYEFKVLDSGIPFERSTLIGLGTKRITTHCETGGSGTGFMTTFETIRKYNASLIITEKPPDTTVFTKSVAIRFDGKNQYIIETYRPEVFPKSENYIVLRSDATE